MNSYEEAASEHNFVKEIISRLVRRRRSLIGGTLLLFTVLAMLIQVYPKTYQGRATVEVLSQTPQAVNRDIVNGEQVFTDQTAGTEIALMTSRELQTRVIKGLKLLDSPEFNPHLKTSLTSELWAWFATTQLASRLPPEWLVSEPVTEDKVLFDTLDTFNRRVKVEPVTHSKIIAITAVSHDKFLAARIANTVADEYIKDHEAQKSAAYELAHSFTQKRVPELRQAMMDKIAEVDSFRQKNNLVSGQYGAILREHLTEATKELVQARSNLERLRANLAIAKSSPALTNPQVVTSETIRDLRVLEANVGERGAGMGDPGSSYQTRWEEKRRAVQARINQEARRIVDSLPTLVSAASTTVLNQQQTVDNLQREVGAMETAQSELQTLQNDATLATKQYNDFYTRSLETNPDVAYTAVNVRLVSASGVPYRSYFPKSNMIMLPAAMVLSFLMVGSLILYRERRPGFRSTDEIRQSFDLDVIGTVPRLTRSHALLYQNAIEALCSRIFWQIAKKTVLLTSVWPSEGKSTIAHAVAMAAAERGISVVLVNADMRATPKYQMRGLADVLNGDATLDEVIISDRRLAVLPSGHALSNPTKLLALPTFGAIMQQLQNEYALVVIDAPPARFGGDAWTLAHFAQEVLLVLKYGSTTIDQLNSTFRTIPVKREDIKIVFNMIPLATGAGELSYSRRMITHYKSA